MKKLFISQPMKGKSDADILAERQKAIKSAEEKIENTCAIEYGIPVIEDYTAE